MKVLTSGKLQQQDRPQKLSWQETVTLTKGRSRDHIALYAPPVHHFSELAV
ncbi:MAG: hypothetical protein AAF821_15770 [Cyanobacteria bacterium P01_D01_bin.156]